MKKKKKIDKIPDLKEFTDELGKKWIQTSTDDLFSMKEINEILESIEKDKDSDKNEVVLARIDFQKVDREYYNAAKALHQKLKEQTELIKKIAEESKKTIEKKNRKLKELIDYIKKIHLFLAYINSKDGIDEIKIPDNILEVQTGKYEPVIESIYEEVKEEVMLRDPK